MQLPSFGDFFGSLEPDFVSKCVKEAAELCDDPDNIGKPSDIIGISWSITYRLLERYHLWLAQQISSGGK